MAGARPAPSPDSAPPARRDGLARLQRMVAGEEPPAPIMGVLDFRLVEVDAGRAVFRGTPRAAFYNPLGTVHGGWTATLLDSALGCAVHSTLDPDEGYTTVEFKVSLTRPIRETTGECVCEGRVVHRGRRIATAEAWLRDGAGKLLAHGTETCLVFPLEAG